MKKLIRTVLIPGMIISLLMLSACQNGADTESTQTPENAVSDENVKETEAEVSAPQEDKKDEQEAPQKPESAEEPKDATDDKTETGDDQDSKETAATGTEISNEAKDAEPEKTAASLKDVYNKIAGSVTLPEMYFADADFMLNYYGIDASKLDDYVFASCLDSTSADSIILIRVKDESYADEVVGCLNTILEEMNIELENYNPEAGERVKSATVRRSGKNIDLIIHKDRSTILSIIDSSL